MNLKNENSIIEKNSFHNSNNKNSNKSNKKLFYQNSNQNLSKENSSKNLDLDIINKTLGYYMRFDKNKKYVDIFNTNSKFLNCYNTFNYNQNDNFSNYLNPNFSPKNYSQTLIKSGKKKFNFNAGFVDSLNGISEKIDFKLNQKKKKKFELKKIKNVPESVFFMIKNINYIYFLKKYLMIFKLNLNFFCFIY